MLLDQMERDEAIDGMSQELQIVAAQRDAYALLFACALRTCAAIAPTDSANVSSSSSLDDPSLA